jgi:Flp pilus assembly protein TadD
MLAGVILAKPDEPPHPFSDEGPIAIERMSPLRVRKPEKGAVIFAARILLTLLSFLYLAFLARIYVSSLYLHRGTEHFLRREYQEAAAVFQQAIDVNARDAEIHLALGRALLLSGNAQEAIRHFFFAENGFNSPRLRQDLAGCYVTVGRSNQAEREYVNGIATYPGHAGLHAGYGAFLVRTGRYDDAITNLLRARDLDPRYPDTYHYMGHLFYGRHQPEQAMVALKDFLEYASPGDPRRSIDSRLLDALQAGERVKGGLDAP